ncbi:DUF4354 family protein [Salmonella enterica]|nr:DUF4354 family protein [Salmonella enterica]EHF4692755.1 DUF4354 family protein [Salmonella enterica subsp. enterica serovar Muenchen]
MNNCAFRLLLISLIFFLPVIAQASVINDVDIYSTEKSTGSFSSGERSVYTKSFEVILKNKANKKISLSGMCLKGLSPDGKAFVLTPADDGLFRKELGPHKTIKGLFFLSSSCISSSRTVLVKLSEDCISDKNETLPFG